MRFLKRCRTCPRGQRLFRFFFAQLVKANLDRCFRFKFLFSALVCFLVVHRGGIELSVVLADVRETVGENIGRKLADAELPDLPPTLWKRGKVSLVALPNQPMPLQALRIHPLAIIENTNCRHLIVKVCREKNSDLERSGVERVRHKLFDCLVRAGIQPRRKEVENLVAQTDVDIVGLRAGRRKVWCCAHCRLIIPYDATTCNKWG